MMISLIVAVAENNVIGKDNKLPWHLPADLKYFKQTSAGHPVIMGRGTFESLGKPLPGRTNIIITRQQHYKADGCIITDSLETAIAFARETGTDEAFILGGGDIFRQSMFLAHRIYLTRIFHNFEGDTFFPELNAVDWKLISEKLQSPDEKNKYSFSFQVFERMNWV